MNLNGGKMEPIIKEQLKGKYVTYLDKDGKMKSGKVMKITGNTLTIKNAVKQKFRIHPKKNKILGRQLKKKIQKIVW